MMRPLPTIFTLLIIASCNQTPAFTENEKATIMIDVKQTLNNYYAEIRKNGLTAEFKYLDHSSDFFWVPPGYSGAITYDSVATILKQNAPLFSLVDNSFDTLRIIPLSPELATYTGRMRSVMTDTTHKTMTYTLLETGVLIKRDDGWKLLHGQTTTLNK